LPVAYPTPILPRSDPAHPSVRHCVNSVVDCAGREQAPKVEWRHRVLEGIQRGGFGAGVGSIN
jgi:hypothetical protein